jgi:mono/diheme cytochrome c family protein
MRGWIPALCVMVVLLGLSLGRAQNSASARAANASADIYSELDKAPEKARAKTNPLQSDPDAPVAGRVLFERYCTECHGHLAEGSHHGPSLRAAEVQDATPGAIFWILTNGVVRHGMPVWSKLPEPQRWQLVAYIKSLGVKQRLPASATP